LAIETRSASCTGIRKGGGIANRVRRSGWHWQRNFMGTSGRIDARIGAWVFTLKQLTPAECTHRGRNPKKCRHGDNCNPLFRRKLRVSGHVDDPGGPPAKCHPQRTGGPAKEHPRASCRFLRGFRIVSTRALGGTFGIAPPTDKQETGAKCVESRAP